MHNSNNLSLQTSNEQTYFTCLKNFENWSNLFKSSLQRSQQLKIKVLKHFNKNLLLLAFLLNFQINYTLISFETSCLKTWDRASLYRFIWPEIIQDSIHSQENEGQRCIVCLMGCYTSPSSIVVWSSTIISQKLKHCYY
jgi:hypothetical protein